MAPATEPVNSEENSTLEILLRELRAGHSVENHVMVNQLEAYKVLKQRIKNNRPAIIECADQWWLTPEAKQSIQDDWERGHGGKDAAPRLIVLENMKLVQQASYADQSETTRSQ